MRRRRGSRRERAASDVIGVLLMVAVAIVLAAMVGSVLLDVIGGVEDDPLAAASVEFEPESDQIRVVYTATQEKGTTIDVRVHDSSGNEVCTETIAEVGESHRFTSANCGVDDDDYTVRIVATAPDGRQRVVQELDGSL